MNIVIDPNEWISEKESQNKKFRESVAQRVKDYQVALDAAGMTVSINRIFVKVSEEMSISVGTVRNICIQYGVIEKKARKGRPSLTA